MTSSAGDALAVTTDHDVVSCFSTADTVTVALRLHPDGTLNPLITLEPDNTICVFS